MSKSMYVQGRRIERISDFDQCESRWYKWNGKTVHRSVLMSLQYRTLLNNIVAGRIYVAERRGRWIKDEEASRQHSESIYVCSACNNMEAWGEVEKNTFKFCPNCGADMRGEVKEE